MKRMTWIIIGSVIAIFLVIFTIWQLSIEITPAHLFFFLIMVIFAVLIYWYLEFRESDEFAHDKTRYAINYCKRWWKDQFGEDIDLRYGQLRSIKYQDYGEGLFKGFIFQVTSGLRKGRFIRLVFSFVDKEIFDINDSPSVDDLLSPLTNTLPNKIASSAAWLKPDKDDRQQQQFSIPVLPVQPQQQADTKFDQSKVQEVKKETKEKVPETPRRYY